MIIAIQNTIGAIRSFLGTVMSGLKMWLPFSSSQQLGKELVVNGDFADGTTNWLKNSDTTLSVSNGQLNIQSANNTYGVAFSTVNFKANRVYRLQLTVVSCNSPTQIRVGTNNSLATGNPSTSIYSSGDIGVGTHIKEFSASSDATYLSIGGRFDVTTLVIDNVSLKEVGQFSLDETTNNNNAKLFTGTCLDFDGSNDYVDIGDTNTNTNTIAITFV